MAVIMCHLERFCESGWDRLMLRISIDAAIMCIAAAVV